MQAESGAETDLYDLRLMMYDRGVCDRRLSDAIISLHDSLCRVCCEAGVGGYLSRAHLLRCADLCRQHLALGVAVETALTDAAMDVYVRSLHDRSMAKVNMVSFL